VKNAKVNKSFNYNWRFGNNIRHHLAYLVSYYCCSGYRQRSLFILFKEICSQQCGDIRQCLYVDGYIDNAIAEEAKLDFCKPPYIANINLNLCFIYYMHAK